MDILEAFVFDNVKHDITILWEDENPLFRATEIGNLLELKNIFTSITKFKAKHKVLRRITSNGGPQEVTFLTEYGVYRLLMLSRKKIAEPFQDWIEEIIVSIRKKGKYELELQKEHMEKTMQEQLNIATHEDSLKSKQKNLEFNSKTFADAYKDRYVVYFGIIKNIEDNILLKIGSTNDIHRRITELEKEYGSMYIIHVFESLQNEAFEKFLHKHESISKFTYKEVIYNGKRSNETFLITKDKLTEFVAIANRNKFKFSGLLNKYQTIEEEKIKLERIAKRIELEEAKNPPPIHLSIHVGKSDEKSDDDLGDDAPIAMRDCRNVTVGRGYKYQIYDTEFKLINTFSSLIDATRNNEYFQDSSKNIIHTAIENNTVYKNYRWMKLDRDLPDDTIQELPPTKETPLVKIGFVAMLNMEKTKIIEVFPDHKSAAANRKFKSGAPITRAVNCGTQSGGHYFQMWFDCSPELKEEYLSRAELPDKLITSCSIPIEKRNALTNKVIKTYSSITDVIKEHQLSRMSLKKAIEFEYVLHGFRWKYVA